MTTITEHSTPTHKQTLGLVLAAELRRSLAAGGIRVTIFVSTGVGALLGGLYVWALAVNGIGWGVSKSALDITPFEVGVSVAAFAFAVGLIGFISREMADGTATGSAILVPRRGRLLAARLLSAVILGAAMTLAVSVIVALIRLIPGGLSGAVFGRLSTVIFVGIADVMLASGLAFLVATLLRKPAVAVAVFVLGLVVLPLVLLIMSAFTPDWLAVPAGTVLKVMPGTLFTRAMRVPVGSGEGWSNVVIGLAGLAAWVVAVAPFTWILFDKALAGKE